MAGDVRGEGVAAARGGAALLEALFRWAPAHGVSRIELEVFANNPAAIRLYERLGFVEEGRRRGAVRVGSETVDVLLMAKLLPEGA